VSKKLREQIYAKFGGRCAYCGKRLKDTFHVDHIRPIYRGRIPREYRDKKEEAIENLNPACRRCNNYKHVLSLEDFREQLSRQVERARTKSLNFRLAEDFELVVETKKSVVFYFEKFMLIHGGGDG